MQIFQYFWKLLWDVRVTTPTASGCCTSVLVVFHLLQQGTQGSQPGINWLGIAVALPLVQVLPALSAQPLAVGLAASLHRCRQDTLFPDDGSQVDRAVFVDEIWLLRWPVLRWVIQLFGDEQFRDLNLIGELKRGEAADALKARRGLKHALHEDALRRAREPHIALEIVDEEVVGLDTPRKVEIDRAPVACALVQKEANVDTQYVGMGFLGFVHSGVPVMSRLTRSSCPDKPVDDSVQSPTSCLGVYLEFASQAANGRIIT